MFPIVEARFLAPDIKRFTIVAPRVARKRKAGQFVILRLHDHGERIPLTIADCDPEKGTVTIIVQGIGKTTKLLNLLEVGDAVLDLVGPLGKPSDIELFGTVVVIGGGLGAAIAYPTAKAMKEAGNYVISIVGARNKELVILEEEIGKISDELLDHDRRWQLRPQGFCHRSTAGVDRRGPQDRPGPGHRPAADDAGRRRDHPAARDQDRRQPQFADGRRHRHVRRLPRADHEGNPVRLRGRAGIRRAPGRFRPADTAEPHILGQ